MLRILLFSNPSNDSEYVVMTDELDADAKEWLLPGYKLNDDLISTPEPDSPWKLLPLGYELHRRD